MTRRHSDDSLRANGRPSIADVGAFIAANLHVRPAPALPDILLYAAHPASGLSRLGAGNADDPPPYWAYGWAGGTVLASHLFSNPECVRGRRVLDLGAGSGLVAIAAAKCGAARRHLHHRPRGLRTHSGRGRGRLQRLEDLHCRTGIVGRNEDVVVVIGSDHVAGNARPA
jgi:hypothetical protein